MVCAVHFSPIAGHVPERAAIKYLVELRDMEMWLAPIAGTRVMVPYRVSVPTPIGIGVLEATSSSRSRSRGRRPRRRNKTQWPARSAVVNRSFRRLPVTYGLTIGRQSPELRLNR